MIADLTVRAKRRSFDDVLLWARGLDEGERVWAIEDCRHVSGALERFLLARGERVVRVPPKLMAGNHDRQPTIPPTPARATLPANTPARAPNAPPPVQTPAREAWTHRCATSSEISTTDISPSITAAVDSG